MEWLKHSKKSAVCELCNTPYKFTKLYAEDMPTMIPPGLLAKRMFGDSINAIVFALRLVLVVGLWLLVLPFFASLLVRTYTTMAELFPGNLKKIIYPMKLVEESLNVSVSGSLSSPLIVLPKGLEDAWPSKLKIALTLVLEGELLIFFLIFCAFVVMIVREWILQNDVFLRDLQDIGRAAPVAAPEPAPVAQPAPQPEVREEVNERDGQEEIDDGAFRIQVDFEIDEENENERGNVNENDDDFEDIPDEVDFGPPEDHPRDVLFDHPLFGRLNDEIRRRDRNRNDNDGFMGVVDEVDEVDEREDDNVVLGRGIGFGPRIMRFNGIDINRNNNPNLPRQFEIFEEQPGMAQGDGNVVEMDGFIDIIGLKGPIVNAFATCAAAVILSGFCLGCFYCIPYGSGRVFLILGTDTLKAANYIAKSLSSYVVGFSYSLLKSNGDSRATSSNVDPFMDMLFGFPQLPKGVLPVFIREIGVVGRLITTITGYCIGGAGCGFAISHSHIAKSRTGREMLRTIREVGAIFKVIAVIGIELVVFPIFCGLLLDFSLLPLFETATVKDQIEFATKYPATSTILHWALGTCYMFIFAMFVALCRKIMRPGVLYFVRDPNDPNFHPIKDVLDRGLMSQLAKIGLSAVIYGALIVVCMGGVIYTLRSLNVEFLPISFSSTTREHIYIMIPMCAGYCLSLPVIIHSIRSLSIMHRIWSNVFESSCSYLRLSSFILNKPVVQEQGSLHYGSILGWFMSTKPDYSHPVTIEDVENNGKWDKVYFVKDGGYVRAPDTDSISSKKKLNLFIPVSKDDARLDGIEEGSRNNELEKYHIVYRPPMFKLRITLLLCSIWGYGALVILAMILVPIYTGHMMTQFLFPSAFKDMCDVFQFIIGCQPYFALFYAADNWTRARDWISHEISYIADTGIASITHTAKIAFLLLMFIIVPSFIGFIVDLYISSPLYLIISSKTAYSKSSITNYMKGLLILISLKNIILQRAPNSRISRNYKRMLENGWLRYDFKTALAELLLPLQISLILLAAIPYAICWQIIQLWFKEAPFELQLRMHVLSYPLTILVAFIAGTIYSLRLAIKLWITKARDEVYLVGRQLENMEH